MDVCLTLGYDFIELGNTVQMILLVCLGLGAVIFVHELGHFAVAKMCGVKCEKFFIGFDVGGYKVSRKWGETEYGIGILPLGGYVKMLGQDDNPANIAEQAERSKALEGSPDAKEIIGPDGQRLLVDRRSYLAKSVPQRMAIISAGVVMNIIFAFVFAFFAFGLGVPQQQPVVGATVPGSPAWEAGLRTGDDLVQLGDVKNPTFEDLINGVMLGDLQEGVTAVVRRADTGRDETIQLVPAQKDGKLARVGLISTVSLRVGEEMSEVKYGPAVEAEGGFQAKDEIVAVDGQPIDTYAELGEVLFRRKDQPLTFQVRRGGTTPANQPYAKSEGGELVEIQVAPNPMERLGIVPQMGPVVAVQDGSPAAAAGIKPGDVLTSIDGVRLGAVPSGEPGIDPMTLDDRLGALARAGEPIEITVDRPTGTAATGTPDGAKSESVTLQITLREVTWFERPADLGDPRPLTSLGVAVNIYPEVVSIVGGSPADGADLAAGDRIISAQVMLQDDKALFVDPLEFTAAEPSWPIFIEMLQDLGPDAKVQLTVARGEATHEVELTPAAVSGAYTATRGIVLEPLKELRVASSLGEQASLAWNATQTSLLTVVTFVKKLGGGQVPLTAIGGPVTIAKAAGYSAFEGLGKLLIFLTMLSANLAVLNFLPIPLLDGGHMVFLLWEGVRGKPASERIVVAFHMIGFAFLVSLMLFVFGLDLGLIPRNL